MHFGDTETPQKFNLVLNKNLVLNICNSLLYGTRRAIV